jgi:hypothetical protein
VVDSEQDVTAPLPHRRVEGHFAGTDKKFVISLPPADKTLAPDVRGTSMITPSVPSEPMNSPGRHIPRHFSRSGDPVRSIRAKGSHSGLVVSGSHPLNESSSAEPDRLALHSRVRPRLTPRSQKFHLMDTGLPIG